MRILFLQDNALDESLALLELSALLEARGHVTGLLLDREEKDLLRATREFRPDLMIIACSMLNHGWARDAARRVRGLKVPILVGGTAPTVYPELLIGAPIDAFFRGEAETPVLGYIHALATGSDPWAVPGLYRFEGRDLVGTPAAAGLAMDAFPIATKDLYYSRYPFMRRLPFKRFLASRGCHHRCSYCYISALNKVQPREPGGRWTRRKSPEQAVEEIAREHARGPLRHVHFSDDLFTDDVAWLEAFAPLFRRRLGITFTCNTSAELVSDRVAAALAEAGCFAAGFAVETGNSEVRKRVLRKGVTEEHIRTAARHLKAHRVKIATFNMVALPGETPDEALETARLNAEIGADFIRMNFCFPMPGTTMCDYALEAGLLDTGFPARFAEAGFRYAPGPQFKTPYTSEFENLFVLFRLAAADERLIPWVRRALGTRTPKPIQHLLQLQGAWNDGRNFRIPVIDGLRYFARVGRPELRATNFPALI